MTDITIRVQRTLKAHVDSSIEIRTETLLGVEYTVVPVIAMVEGVRYGSNQDSPELGLATEFGYVPVAWANRPLVLNHPQVDGAFVSANTPSILELYQFGVTMNPEIKDNKLHMEAWIDTARVKKLGGDFKSTVAKILKKEEVEVSVGFFSDVTPQKGKYKGQAYSGIWTNIKPDHLAILSDAIGACSIEDGCGVPRINEANQIGEEMADLKVNCSCEDEQPSAQESTDEITVDGAKNAKDAKKDKKKYMSSVPSIQGTAPLAIELEVLESHMGQRVLNKAAVDLAFKGQAIHSSLMNNDVYKMVSLAVRKKFGTYSYLLGYTNEAAIYESYDNNNGGYVCMQVGMNVTDTSVEFVGDPNEVILQTKIVPQTATTQESDMADVKTNETTETNTPPAISKPAEAAPAPAVQEKKLTAQEYIDNAPAEVREALQSAMKLQSNQKAAAIKTLTEYKGNKFSEEHLKTQSLEVLENMVALLPPSFQGMAAPTSISFTTNTDGKGETVPAPLVFERKKVA